MKEYDDALEVAALIAESEWQSMKDTEAAHYRLSPTIFRMENFGFNPCAVNKGREIAFLIRNMKSKAKA